LGGVAGLRFAEDRGRVGDWEGSVTSDFEATGVGALSSMIEAVTGSSCAGTASCDGAGSSSRLNEGFGEASARCANSGGACLLEMVNLRGLVGRALFSDSVASFFGTSNLRRLAGLSCMSLSGDIRPEPNGSAEGLWSGSALPKSTLPRCCLIRLISAIHAGCAGGGCFSLGESGLLRALSSQLDFVGLHRFEGLGGDVSSCGWSLS
jgi:hypothetical protein